MNIRRLVLLFLSYTLAALGPSAFATKKSRFRQNQNPLVSRDNPLPLPTKATPTTDSKDCSALLGPVDPNLMSSFLKTGTKYHEVLLHEHDIFPTALKKVEVVQQIADALLVRQGGQFKLTRMNALTPQNAPAIALDGSTFVQGWRSGDVYYVRTRRSRDQTKNAEHSKLTDLLYLIPLSLESAELTAYLDPNLQIKRLMLPNEGGELIICANLAFIEARIPAGKIRSEKHRLLTTSQYAHTKISFSLTPRSVNILESVPLLKFQVPEEQEGKGINLTDYYFDYQLMKHSFSGPQRHHSELFNFPAEASVKMRTNIVVPPAILSPTGLGKTAVNMCIALWWWIPMTTKALFAKSLNTICRRNLKL